MSLEVIKGIEHYTPQVSGVVATIGTFDGLHLGHHAILKRLRDAAEEYEYHPVVITFDPHPREIVTPHSPPLLLTTIEEKIKLLPEYIDGTMLILRFTEELKNMSARDFVTSFLIDKLNIARLIVGYDHAFGKDRDGTIGALKEMAVEFGFDIEVVPPILINDMPISSSRIRRLFINGDYKKAKQLLDHPYPVIGKVERGIGLGRKLGYPTANLKISPRKLLPKDGVYSCSVEVRDESFRGMMFIGKNHFNPTVSKVVEVNIFDFDEDIYGENIFVYPENFIRENRKYDDTGALVKQIALDKKEVLKLINKGV